MSDTTKTWGIVGLGWLGSALSRRLNGLSQKTWGTHRDVFDFSRDSLPTTFCDILFLNTPPILSLSPKAYVEKVEDLNQKRVIFVSSTSVYGESQSHVTETATAAPTKPAGQWLLDTENELTRKFKQRLLIVRPGGLIGDKRHPIYHLSGRSGVTGGEGPVNLVHQEDLVNIILLFSEDKSVSLVNAVSPHHPLKKTYYEEWAKRLKLEPPEFVNSAPSDRKIDSQVLKYCGYKWACQSLDRL